MSGNNMFLEHEKKLLGICLSERMIFLCTAIANAPEEDSSYRKSILRELIQLHDISSKYGFPLSESL